MSACRHRLCELLGGPCSLAAARSRGCRPNQVRALDPAIFDELRALVAAVEAGGAFDRAAAVQLADRVRRAALEGRNLVALVRAEELDFADAFARLCARAA